MTRSQLVRPLVPLVVIAGLALAAAPARSQSCGAGWRDPVVCQVDLVVTRPGERRGETLQGSTLDLPRRTEVELHVVPTDQWNRRFPADHFRFELDVTRGCSGFFDVERVDEETVRIKTGVRSGECDATLWVANNTNFDRPIRFRIEHGSAHVYSRREAEYIAGALYHAILGRDADPQGLDSTAAAIQRGELPGQVHAMLGSSEFNRERAHRSAQDLLRDFYQSILGREPDAAGSRTYMPRMQRGELAYVLTDMLTSDEFEERLNQAVR